MLSARVFFDSEPDTITPIQMDQLNKVLAPYAEYFSRRGVDLPTADSTEKFPFDKVAQVLTNPDPHVPFGMVKALNDFVRTARPSAPAKKTEAAELDSPQPNPADKSNPDATTIKIQRKRLEDGVHWMVNGVDKGIFSVRAHSIRAKIIDILYDQIGYDWVRHKTFINACGWTVQHYTGGCVLQKHLTDIRAFLGVEIFFDKSRGVKFADNVVRVKSKEQSR